MQSQVKQHTELLRRMTDPKRNIVNFSKKFIESANRFAITSRSVYTQIGHEMINHGLNESFF